MTAAATTAAGVHGHKRANAAYSATRTITPTATVGLTATRWRDGPPTPDTLVADAPGSGVIVVAKKEKKKT